MLYPEIVLRQFCQNDGNHISNWMMDEAYFTFFRHVSVYPTFEECCNYPSWAQNIVMMVEDGTGKTIGMANAYEVNVRNRVCKAGLLIDKDLRESGYGHAAQVRWLDFLFSRMGFRKIQVENVHEFLTEPYIAVGFSVEGINRKQCEVNGEYIDETVMGCFREDFVGLKTLEGS